MSDNYRIGFIGGGNMARSLMGGLLAGGIAAERLAVAEPDPGKRAELAADFAVETLADNRRLAAAVDVVVLAVKPQVLRDVVAELAATLTQPAPLLVSIAAGVRVTSLSRWFGRPTAIVRAMPNTPSLVRSGAAALFANDLVNATQRSRAESVLRAVGQVLWVEDEAQLDAVTALSGSGPAYFFLVMEALEEAAVELGLPRATARLLTLETALGAARMALSSADEPATLRAQVTSPGGTTERALDVFADGDLRGLIRRALHAAHDRSRELAALLDDC